MRQAPYTRVVALLALLEVLLVAGLVTFGVTTLRVTRDRVQHITESSARGNDLVRAVREDVLLLEKSALEDLNTDDPRREAALDQRMAAARAEIAAALGAYREQADSPEESESWRQFQHELDRYLIVLDDVTALDRGRRAADARQAYELRLAPIGDRLGALSRRLAQIELASEGTYKEAIERTQARASFALAAVGLLAAVLVLAAAWVARRRLLSQETLIQGHLEELAQRNRELDSFAGRVAHDLNTPLSTLLVSLDLLRRVDDSRRVEILGRARQSVMRMSGLIQALLQFSRAAGEVKPGGAAVGAAFRQVARELEPALAARGVELAMALPPLAVAIDPDLLRSVITNLLENAIKYMGAQPEPWIRVRAAASKGMVRIEVADNGIGIDPGDLGRVFAPFFRADQSAVPGHGLGLATVHRVLQAHGGGVAVSSMPGRGSSFAIQLPRCDLPPGHQVPEHAPASPPSDAIHREAGAPGLDVARPEPHA